MEHAERRRWCERISAINEQMNGDDAAAQPRRIDLRQMV
jgi:hypothetical protein